MTCVAPACTLKGFVLGPVVVEEVVDVVDAVEEVLVVDEVEELELLVVELLELEVVVVTELLASKVAMIPVQTLPIKLPVPVLACPVEETIFWKYPFATLPGLLPTPSINVNPFVGELMPLRAAIDPTHSSTACDVNEVVPVFPAELDPLFEAVLSNGELANPEYSQTFDTAPKVGAPVRVIVIVEDAPELTTPSQISSSFEFEVVG
jgi:hypothetical protein